MNLKRFKAVLRCFSELKTADNVFPSKSPAGKQFIDGADEVVSSQRGIFMGRNPAVKNVSQSAVSVFPTLEVGKKIITPGLSKQLRIVEFAGQGHRAKIYKTEDYETGDLFALKVIHDSSPINVASIAKDSVKTNILKENHINHAGIIEEGVDYVLKVWLDGILGDSWVEAWINNGSIVSDTYFQALMDFYKQCSQKGIHIDNLKPANMMLMPDGSWNPFDPGVISTGLKSEEIIRRYTDKFIRRWIYVSNLSLQLLLYWSIWKKFQR
ncbi:MAG: hypothetical protein GY864_00560 [Desulfobacterales bacterium]|nr:hypothetical protein [Desulfobacterales bacterium]